jgi:hypothetical protein
VVGGSGFLVTVDYAGNEDSELGHVYVVTARHVLLDTKTQVPYPNPAVTFVTTEGLQVVETSSSDWEPHPDGHDVAVASFDPGGRGTAHMFLSPSAFVTPAVLQEWDIGLGDDVFYMGRFQPPEGKSIPTVRFGQISHMPVKVWHDDFKCWVDSFLVEGRSRGGFSGSPVLVRFPWFRIPAAERDIPGIPPDMPLPLAGVALIAGIQIDRWILGVTWGHTTELQQGRVGRGVPVDLDVNEGIVCVTPAWRILDILNGPRFTVQRERDEADYRDGRKPVKRRVVSDSLGEPANPFTRPEFLDDLRKITKQPKEPS